MTTLTTSPTYTLRLMTFIVLLVPAQVLAQQVPEPPQPGPQAGGEQSNSAAAQSPKPETFEQITIGMSKTAVLEGLKERYAFSEMKTSIEGMQDTGVR